MNRKVFEQYSQLKEEEKRIKNEIAAVIKMVLIEMGDNDEVEVDGCGKFVMTKRRVWTYPDNVLEAKDKFENLKKESEAKGTATYEQQSSLRYYGLGDSE